MLLQKIISATALKPRHPAEPIIPQRTLLTIWCEGKGKRKNIKRTKRCSTHRLQKPRRVRTPGQQHPCGHGAGATRAAPCPLPRGAGRGRAAPAPSATKSRGSLPPGTPAAPRPCCPVLTPAIPRCWERRSGAGRPPGPGSAASSGREGAGREGKGRAGQDPPAAAPPSASAARRAQIGAGPARPQSRGQGREAAGKPGWAWPAMEARQWFCLDPRPCEHPPKLRPLFVPPARPTREREQNESLTSKP